MHHLLTLGICILTTASRTLALLDWHSTLPFPTPNQEYDEATLLLQKEFRDGERPPIVWVPGLTSSNLTYELVNSPNPYFPFCPKSTDGPQPLWPTPTLNTTADALCWFSDLNTPFDQTAPGNPYHPRQGATVSVLDMGNFSGTALWFMPYYYAPYGYVVGQDLFNVPFDWRLPLDGLTDFYASLKATIEHASQLNNNRKVALLSVSWGPQVALGFLHRMTQEWKDQYIAWYVAESPLYSGSPVGALAVTSGYASDPTQPTSATFIRAIATQVDVMMNLLPRAGTSNVTWPSDFVLVKTPNKSYSAYDMPQLYADLGFSYNTRAVYHVQQEADLAEFAPPGVNTFITYGYNISTAGSLVYAEDFQANASYCPPLPTVVPDPATGDSLVPVRSSLRAAAEWPTKMAQAGQELVYKAYANQPHAYCISPAGPDGCFFDVMRLILNNTKPSGHFSELKDAPHPI
eukprot:m.262849 g.262849  ORF g.262849 m.262849 type:complete len:461 (+) comp17610_c0_seq3:108-1490(+)